MLLLLLCHQSLKMTQAILSDVVAVGKDLKKIMLLAAQLAQSVPACSKANFVPPGARALIVRMGRKARNQRCGPVAVKQAVFKTDVLVLVTSSVVKQILYVAVKIVKIRRVQFILLKTLRQTLL